MQYDRLECPAHVVSSTAQGCGCSNDTRTYFRACFLDSPSKAAPAHLLACTQYCGIPYWYYRVYPCAFLRSELCVHTTPLT